MPYLNVKLCAEPSQELTEKIAAVLTELTAEVLKKKRDVTAVVVEYVSPTQWFIGGDALAGRGQSFYLDIKITEGTNTKDEKALYVALVFSTLEALMGPLAPASYIVIHEVRGDAWGFQGHTQEFRYIKGKSL